MTRHWRSIGSVPSVPRRKELGGVSAGGLEVEYIYLR